eukprot:TRINITY_DN41297_c0_g1_i1.p1 TRINITY_DN41297_c0_g1~~TRINITY_DN41297_c0_g1_i1.p1  ORF type:complete len:241 (-),score=14.33 TRINITY_DN41297_c0_g1_i1:80-802(-)
MAFQPVPYFSQWWDGTIPLTARATVPTGPPLPYRSSLRLGPERRLKKSPYDNTFIQRNRDPHYPSYYDQPDILRWEKHHPAPEAIPAQPQPLLPAPNTPAPVGEPRVRFVDTTAASPDVATPSMNIGELLSAVASPQNNNPGTPPSILKSPNVSAAAHYAAKLQDASVLSTPGVNYCKTCGQAIYGRQLRAQNDCYHPDCFKCPVCLNPFRAGERLLERQGQRMHGSCAAAIEQQQSRRS